MSRSKIIEKIEKLLALATSPNEFEATRAMEKAAEILKKHNLSMSDILNNKKEYKLHSFGQNMGKRTPEWKKTIFARVSNVFDCALLVVKVPKEDSLYQILGHLEDLKLTRHFCDFFCGVVEEAGKMYFGTTKDKNDFKYGMSIKITDRLKQMHTILLKDETTALVVIEKKKKINDYIDSLGNIKTKKLSGRNQMSRKSFFDGVAAGENICLNTPIQHEKKVAIH